MAGRCIAFFARSRYFFLILNFWTNLSLLYQILFGLLDGILLCATAVPPFGNPHPANAGLKGCKQPGLHGGVGFICYFMEISWQKKARTSLA